MLAITMACLSIPYCYAASDPKPVVIGYVGGYRGRIINMDMISATKLTHINYAFVNVQHNRAVLSRERTDTVNLKNLSLLKKRNPNIKLLISIGGWSWSGNFSDAVLSDTSRQAFARSAVAILNRFNLDGIDIDWEYPDMNGNGNIHRKEDKQNYTLMFMELRRQLDIAGKQQGKKLLLTTATGGFKEFLNHTEMDKAYPYLDYINLMTYDYFGNKTVVHHTNLFTSFDKDRNDSGDKAVRDYLAAGVPASKLVMGLAFYGRMFQLKNSATKGFGDSTVSHLRLADYVFIKDSLVNQKGFVKYQDTVAKAPYLFNAATKQFVTYEDEWSVDNKCKYVLANKMAGVMFWEYASDPKDYLLDQINASFKSNSKIITAKP
ncbi:MAG: glycoside hydrolase family 18 protein [Bacteroidota bacterium]